MEGSIAEAGSTVPIDMATDKPVAAKKFHASRCMEIHLLPFSFRRSLAADFEEQGKPSQRTGRPSGAERPVDVDLVGFFHRRFWILQVHVASLRVHAPVSRQVALIQSNWTGRYASFACVSPRTSAPDRTWTRHPTFHVRLHHVDPAETPSLAEDPSVS